MNLSSWVIVLILFVSEVSLFQDKCTEVKETILTLVYVIHQNVYNISQNEINISSFKLKSI